MGFYGSTLSDAKLFPFAALIRRHFNGLRGPPVVGALSATHEGINQGFLQGQAAVFARINGEWFRIYKMRSS
jgi:hypothetical protein